MYQDYRERRIFYDTLLISTHSLRVVLLMSVQSVAEIHTVWACLGFIYMSAMSARLKDLSYGPYNMQFALLLL